MARVVAALREVQLDIGTRGRITSREAVANLRVVEQTQSLLQSNVQEALTLEVGLLKLRL